MVDPKNERIMLALQVHWYRKHKDRRYDWLELAEPPVYELI